VTAAVPSALVSPMDEDASGGLKPRPDQVQQRMDAATSVVVGPGLGTHSGAVAVLAHVLDGADSPLALDADALNILAAKADMRSALRPGTVLTPHPGEMARLAGLPRDAVQADRAGVASRFAALHKVVVVLKGAQTVVTDGERLYVNATGGHGLARGGTGDVLAGVLGALLAQKLSPMDAAALAVHAHGLAGDRATARLGARGMTAEDVADALPEAWRELERA
jgi:NAD(P)H-hydrate epimerase